MPKLTKKLIDTSLPKEKDYTLWDNEIKGFGCRILPTGHKTYVFFYRSPTTKKYSYLKIGVHGNYTPDTARDKAKELCATIAKDIDPKEKKRVEKIEERQSILFEAFWRIFTEKYIKEEHKKTTIAANNSRIQNHILPFFGKKKITEITTKDILVFQESLLYIKGNCTKCLSLLGAAFAQAELWGYRPKNSNPCKGVVRHPDKKMNRFLSEEEAAKLDNIITESAKVGIASSYTLAAYRLLLLTGCRKNEILTLKWSDVHLKESYFYVKERKGVEMAVPLSQRAKEVMLNIPKQEGNPYVFCGKKQGTHLVDVQKTWKSIRKKADISDVRIHDLRHSFASFALKKGVDLYTVSKLLGHKSITTTIRYAHLELEPLKKATNKVAEVFK